MDVLEVNWDYSLAATATASPHNITTILHVRSQPWQSVARPHHCTPNARQRVPGYRYLYLNQKDALLRFAVCWAKIPTRWSPCGIWGESTSTGARSQMGLRTCPMT